MDIKKEINNFYTDVKNRERNYPLELHYEKEAFIICIDTYEEAKKVLGANMMLAPAIYPVDTPKQKAYLIFIPEKYFKHMTAEAFVFTVAHEMGHAVLGHDGLVKTHVESIPRELGADAFAIAYGGRKGGIEMFEALRKGVKESFGKIKGFIILFSLRGEWRARLNALTL